MNKTKKYLITGAALIAAFVLWTVLIMSVDVKPVGQNGTDIGFSTVNTWFHALTGENMTVYTITDWLGLVPIAICMGYGFLGLCELIKRRSLFKVDADIILLGVYYILVIIGYLVFEMIPINYRPIPINGYMEASYPSSTTLLVLSVMPTLIFQTYRRAKSDKLKRAIAAAAVLFSAFMVTGRLTCGVHWLTDIAGSVLLSFGLFYIYRGAVEITDGRKREKENEDTCI